MSAYFWVPRPKKISVGDLLLFGKLIDSTSESQIHLPNYLSRDLPKDRPTRFPGVDTPPSSTRRAAELAVVLYILHLLEPVPLQYPNHRYHRLPEYNPHTLSLASEVM